MEKSRHENRDGFFVVYIDKIAYNVGVNICKLESVPTLV